MDIAAGSLPYKSGEVSRSSPPRPNGIGWKSPDTGRPDCQRRPGKRPQFADAGESVGGARYRTSVGHAIDSISNSPENDRSDDPMTANEPAQPLFFDGSMDERAKGSASHPGRTDPWGRSPEMGPTQCPTGRDGVGLYGVRARSKPPMLGFER